MPAYNERTVVGGVFPFSAVGNNLPVWTSDSEDAVLLPALLSSFVCDLAARFKVGGTHLNFFIAEQVPVLPPEVSDRLVPWSTGDSVREWMLPRVLELTYTAGDIEPFAANSGRDVPPFRWDHDRRFLLRCELDAAFFHLYLPANEDGSWRAAGYSDGRTCDETPEQLTELRCRFPTPRAAVYYIMDTFPIVRRQDEQKHGNYRTKCLILNIYDGMLASITSTKSYRTQCNLQPTAAE